MKIIKSNSRVNKYVADTMAFILRLEKRKMPNAIKAIFIQAENGTAEIRIPALVFAELGYLSEKGKIEATLADALRYIKSYPSISEYPMTFQVIDMLLKLMISLNYMIV